MNFQKILNNPSSYLYQYLQNRNSHRKWILGNSKVWNWRFGKNGAIENKSRNYTAPERTFEKNQNNISILSFSDIFPFAQKTKCAQYFFKAPGCSKHVFWRWFRTAGIFGADPASGNSCLSGAPDGSGGRNNKLFH